MSKVARRLLDGGAGRGAVPPEGGDTNGEGVLDLSATELDSRSDGLRVPGSAGAIVPVENDETVTEPIRRVVTTGDIGTNTESPVKAAANRHLEATTEGTVNVLGDEGLGSVGHDED